jgi:NAD(P)-dependent dehydrogenase (short-subunit alcohol dehydrogenase family)
MLAAMQRTREIKDVATDQQTAGLELAVVVDRDTAAGEATAGIIRQQGGEALFIAADVTKSADVQAYVKAALDAYGSIDCFHNNAGIEGSVAPTAQYDEAMFDTVMAVNVKGVFLGMRHVLPVMLQQKRGAIVNTASVAGIRGSVGLSAYNAAKHGVVGLTRNAALEFASAGVRVNCICPGIIDTPLVARAFGATEEIRETMHRFHPLGRMRKPAEIAKCVLFLASDDASFVTGHALVVDGGISAGAGNTTGIATN